MGLPIAGNMYQTRDRCNGETLSVYDNLFNLMAERLMFATIIVTVREAQKIPASGWNLRLGAHV